jgi:hypothetical protein
LSANAEGMKAKLNHFKYSKPKNGWQGFFGEETRIGFEKYALKRHGFSDQIDHGLPENKNGRPVAAAL